MSAKPTTTSSPSQTVTSSPIPTTTTTIISTTTQHNTTFTTSGITTDSTTSHDDPNTATVIGAILGITLVAISIVILLYYFTRYRHNRFDLCKKLRRRTWSSGSNYSQHNPLEPDETGTSDPVPTTDRKFFSISENDDDGFIYDEIFDASEFVDKETRKANRNLYKPTRTSEEVPDLNLRL